jgi:hypothetical protein
MATGPRISLIPALFNTGPVNSVLPLYATVGAAGVDAAGAGGTAFATLWTTASSLGVLIPNQSNGGVWLYYTCGATAAGVYQVLIGDLAGTSGQVPPATAESGTIAASTSGWLGPFSPSTYNQQSPTTVTYTGAINTTALTAAALGCVVIDFTTTTTLCVRAYQNVTVNP